MYARKLSFQFMLMDQICTLRSLSILPTAICILPTFLAVFSYFFRTTMLLQTPPC